MLSLIYPQRGGAFKSLILICGELQVAHVDTSNHVSGGPERAEKVLAIQQLEWIERSNLETSYRFAVLQEKIFCQTGSNHATCISISHS